MASEPSFIQSRLASRKYLVRGESVIASVGITLAALLLVVMAASAWWTHHTQRAVAETTRADQVRAVGDLLSQSAEAMLTHNDLSAARRVVLDASHAYRLTKCRIVLPDGQVIAASDSTQITTRQLPAVWPVGRSVTEVPPEQPGVISLSFPLAVAGRGGAELEISAATVSPYWTDWQTQAGVGAIGAAALVVLLVIYRRIRYRLRAMGAIREALLAARAGESGAAILSVNPILGPEAVSWNQIITDLSQSRKLGVAEHVRETLGRRHEVKGDLDAAVDALSQGLMLVDEHNRVKYANGAAAVLLRAKREELVGGELSQFMKVESVLEAVREVAGGSVRRRAVLDVERNDEGDTGVLRFSVRPVRREDSASAMLTIEDITQQKVAEEARHNFVAQATHELRTPLTNIRLYVETAIDEGEANPATRAKCLNVINGETRRLERIVGEMLSVAEIEAGSFKITRAEVRLDGVFSELKADYQQQAKEKDIELTFNLPPKFPVVRGDRDKIMLALHNLVGNALKYTPERGHITVGVEFAGGQMTVNVKDTGIGILPADAEKIFDRFYRAKDPRVAKVTGTGLGLTLAREVVRLHGGDITVESEVNRGSTFTLTLPMTSEAA